MIIASSPLRISFFGGGSDLPAFTAKETGAALSVTIDKYVHVIYKPGKQKLRFIHEDITGLDSMRNPIAKAFFNNKGLEYGDVISLSDVPSIGSGLGGSSAFSISLIQAFDPYLYTPKGLAERACELEIDQCGYPIGIQDQYAIANGGFKLYSFHANPREARVVSSLNIRSEDIIDLQRRLLLVYSGISRNGSAGTILQEQQKSMAEESGKHELMKRIRDRARVGFDCLTKGNLHAFGELLHYNWMDKRGLSDSLSNNRFDSMYEFGLANGALGGKLLGAGGGGFFLFYCPSYEVRDTLAMKIVGEFPDSDIFPFKFVDHSTKITRI